MSPGEILTAVSKAEDQCFDKFQDSLTPANSCHPTYLTPKAHDKLSAPGAFDGLRIHTDGLDEVIARITPRTLTIAVVRPQSSTISNFAPSSRPDANLFELDYGFNGLVRSIL